MVSIWNIKNNVHKFGVFDYKLYYYGPSHSRFIVYYFQNLLNLKSLNLDNGYYLGTRTEYLFQALLNSKCLTCIALGEGFEMNNQKLKMLSKKLPNFKILWLNGKNRTSAGLIKFVESCKNLKELNVGDASSEDFENKIVDVIQILLKRREKKILFYPRKCEDAAILKTS